MEAGSPHLEETLRDIRKLPPDSLDARFMTTIPEERIPTTYIQQLNAADRTTVQRACLLAWAVTGGTQVPREPQLRVLLAIYHGIDCLFYAGTGSGKTLPIALLLLLDDPENGYVSLTISPLKRLQVTQVSGSPSFITKLQIVLSLCSL